MSEKILEIGCGSRPLGGVPGSMITDEVDYFGVDINHEQLTDSSVAKGLDTMGSGHLVAADSAMLPIPDETFTHAIMRSVFGEYTMPPKYTNGSLDNTFLGLSELFRVLKTGGKVAIAEENTPYAPATPAQIGGVLLNTGFIDINVYPCQGMKNTQWLEERTKYWGMRAINGDTTRTIGEPIDKEWGFLITATRPDVELEEFTARVLLKGIWQSNSALPWNDPRRQNEVRTLQFKHTATTPEDTDDTLNLITVHVHEEPVIGLDDYYTGVHERRRSGLFA